MSQSRRTAIYANLPLALALLAGCGDASPDCPITLYCLFPGSCGAVTAVEAFEFGGGPALIESPFCVSPRVR